MKIELWPVDRPKPYPRNARRISDLAIEKVARSIKDFGWRQPIVVDGEGVIIAGHTRLLAAKKMGAPEVPVCVAADLSPEQVKAYRLADNRSHEEAEWDLDMLGAELFDLKGLGFDLGATAFDEDELADLLTPKGLIGDEDAVPEAPANPVTVTGDVFRLGTHRLMCGDSTKGEDVAYLMDGVKADMVFTDPPYNVAVCGGDHNPLGRTYGKGKKISNDSMADGEFRDFLVAAFTAMAAAVKRGAVAYICHADTEGVNFRSAFVSSGFDLKQCLIWAKQQFVFGRSDYHWQHEPILYGWLAGAAHKFYGEKNQGTVWAIDRPMRSAMNHPTQKPVCLIQKALTNSSRPGDAVYDPFCGSGTTLIACESEGRRCYAMEIDPVYCDVIVARWETATGKKAVLEATGQTLDQLREQRMGVVA